MRIETPKGSDSGHASPKPSVDMSMAVIDKLNKTIEAHDSVLAEMDVLRERNDELRQLRDTLAEGAANGTSQVLAQLPPNVVGRMDSIKTMQQHRHTHSADEPPGGNGIGAKAGMRSMAAMLRDMVQKSKPKEKLPPVTADEASDGSGDSDSVDLSDAEQAN